MKRENIFNKISRWIGGNLGIIVLFVLSTSFFCFQHFLSLPWDFSAYVLNAKYFFSNGFYLEAYRAPLMPFLIGILSKISGWVLAEYLYILLVSGLFAVSSYFLAKSLDMDPLIFYALSLNLYVLAFGVIQGTELLSLVFLELFIASIIKPDLFRFRGSSGFFIALTTLARYTSIVFFPLIILKGKLKDNLWDIVLFFLPWLPWLYFNFHKFGNMFASVANSYALNVLFRGYINDPMNPLHFLGLFNLLIPLFVLGLIFSVSEAFKGLKKLFEKRKKYFNASFDFLRSRKAELLMVLVLVVSLYQYERLPVKSIRYLFNAVIPVVYFSSKGLGLLKTRKLKISYKKVIAIFLFLISISTLFWVYTTGDNFWKRGGDIEDFGRYEKALNKLEELGVDKCALKSNSWIFFNYMGKAASSPPRDELLNYYLNKGYKMVFFKKNKGFEGFENRKLSNYTLYHSNEMVMLGDREKCAPQGKVDSTYLFRLNRSVFLRYNHSININPCYILFSDSVFGKSCNVLNFRRPNYMLEEIK